MIIILWLLLLMIRNYDDYWLWLLIVFCIVSTDLFNQQPCKYIPYNCSSLTSIIDVWIWFVYVLDTTTIYYRFRSKQVNKWMNIYNTYIAMYNTLTIWYFYHYSSYSSCYYYCCCCCWNGFQEIQRVWVVLLSIDTSLASLFRISLHRASGQNNYGQFHA